MSPPSPPDGPAAGGEANPNRHRGGGGTAPHPSPQPSPRRLLPASVTGAAPAVPPPSRTPAHARPAASRPRPMPGSGPRPSCVLASEAAPSRPPSRVRSAGREAADSGASFALAPPLGDGEGPPGPWGRKGAGQRRAGRGNRAGPGGLFTLHPSSCAEGAAKERCATLPSDGSGGETNVGQAAAAQGHEPCPWPMERPPGRARPPPNVQFPLQRPRYCQKLGIAIVVCYLRSLGGAFWHRSHLPPPTANGCSHPTIHKFHRGK